MKYSSFSQSAALIAVSNKPFCVVVAYSTLKLGQGEVLSTHKTHDLARIAASKSGYSTFLCIRDSRDYA